MAAGGDEDVGGVDKRRQGRGAGRAGLGRGGGGAGGLGAAAPRSPTHTLSSCGHLVAPLHNNPARCGGLLCRRAGVAGWLLRKGGRERGRHGKGGSTVVLGPDLVQSRGGGATGYQPAGRRRGRRRYVAVT